MDAEAMRTGSPATAPCAGGRGINELMPVVYPRLRSIAASYLEHERPGHTLQATALVNEAYARLAVGDGAGGAWEGRTHLIAVAARAMRNILLKHARDRRACKRGGGLGESARVPLWTLAAYEERSVDLVALDEALARLAALDPEQARLVELRFFGGLSVADAAAALGISLRGAERQWAVARAWLWRELGGSAGGDGGGGGGE